MKTGHLICAFLSAVSAAACDGIVSPENSPAVIPSFAAEQARPPIAASGTFVQTSITGLQVRPAGPNAVLDQTSSGTVSGTLSGTYEDDLRVVIHPNGRFNANFSITCTCTVDGQSGVLELVASDAGQMVSPTLGAFTGQATITGGTGALSELRGTLEINGTVDLATGLSTYDYSGAIH